MREILLEHRLRILFVCMGVVTAMIISKLFYLQVVKYDHYIDLALKNQQGFKKLPASRGQILIKDYHSNDSFKLATNTTYETLFADPSMVNEPRVIAEKLGPLLFDPKLALQIESERVLEQKKVLSENPELTEEDQELLIQPKSLEVLRQDYTADLIAKISAKKRSKVLLDNDPATALIFEIRALGLPGVEANEKGIFLYPEQISDYRKYAKLLAPKLDISLKSLMSALKGSNKYVVLKKRLAPELVSQLKEMFVLDKKMYFGLGFQSESYRFYPEGELLAQVVGYTNVEGGQYGLERDMDELLSGEDGLFKAKVDGLGKQLTVDSETLINPAVNGSDIYLTIDRSVQMFVEKVLKEDVQAYGADAGQVIVMRPKTGEIVALANYPTFDPNKFYEALDRKEFEPPKIEVEDLENPGFTKLVEDENWKDKVKVEKEYGTIKTYFYEDEESYKRVELLPVLDKNKKLKFYEVYKNKVGSAVFPNRTVFDAYEPGSVFKPITMAGALNSNLLTPETTVNDDGPIRVDEFKINNALNEHYGVIDMTQVLETSNNIGMAFVAKTLGRRLFFDYIEKFGFGVPTGLEVKNERDGLVKSHLRWAESELVTHAFGQGLTVTPMQMIQAFSAVINDGILVKPYMIEKIVADKGVETVTEPTVVRRVVSKETSNMLRVMLESVVVNGQGKVARVPGFSVGGKTGTAQTYKNGKPLSGPGTTFTTFVGFAPVDNPEFIILTKFDKPRSSQWASATAIYTFQKIAKFMLDYLAIPPSRL